jgi:DNA-3-methyladenine glycosylase I
MTTSYCAYAPSHPLHKLYHDTEYGFLVREDNALFERLVLEINQAGLSWLTVLKKREAFRLAYHGFDLDQVARYDDVERVRLMADARIIRNRLKINAAIENARRVLQLREQHGSFAAWLDHHHPQSRESWQKLFKKSFVFTGGEIVGEFLLSTGYLPGAHEPTCPVYELVLEHGPPWAKSTR